MDDIEYCAVDGMPLSWEEEFNARGLMRHLAEKHKEGEVRLLYRGETTANLRQKLTTTHTGTTEVFGRAFYFGDKARHFYSDRRNEEDRTFLSTINDSSVATFEFIFDRVAQVIREPKLRRKVNDHTSGRFRDFFLEPNNREVFVRSAQAAFNEENRLKVRDYYLYFLHVAGSSGVRRETMFVSTSTQRRVAEGFSVSGKRDSGSRVVFHYFIPQPLHRYAIAPWVSDHHHRIAKKCGLPTFQPAGLFPSQQEVSVKGALFPQFILGLEVVHASKRQFIVNPHALTVREDRYDDVAKYGIPIDQADFANRIFDTGYIRWGERDEEGNYDEYEVS